MMANAHPPEEENSREQRIASSIDRLSPQLTALSDRIWELAETKFEEFGSARLLADRLEEAGFDVSHGIGGLPTAFMASFGQGDGPVIALLGEYDALPGLSQRDGVDHPEPLLDGSGNDKGNGHGCGHHLLGTGSLAAAIALKEYLSETGLPGTIRYYGCPAEEGGSGKTFLVREGAFDGVDAALTWHPGYGNAVVSMTSAANYQVRYRFEGRSSHAAASPHTGRSALDAVELMNVGANYLREHVPQSVRFHYAVTNTGGFSPNVVQAKAEVVYLIRAPEVRDVEAVYARINDIAQGAALMTGTEVHIHFEKACSNLIPNVTLERMMQRCFEQLGVPAFTEREQRYAAAISATLAEPSGGSSPIPPPLPETLDVYEPEAGSMLGSTDVADVSWIIPTAQLETVCFTRDTPFHSWQMVAQGRSSAAHKGMLHAAKVMAATAAALMAEPSAVLEATQELRRRGGIEGYACPIPGDVLPPVHPSSRV
ncbi:M20 family metallopeptidase [Paenibacillus senegalimassiliensis]|uniref:M20 family metallopeptidase n=1 Tax=Paenibacillus senegalimassiliensis TaxID=1737426 RepID=UPI0009E89B85|nr:M20 family metallopeptidase [Paenibacillus senegalimassiliensis]